MPKMLVDVSRRNLSTSLLGGRAKVEKFKSFKLVLF